MSRLFPAADSHAGRSALSRASKESKKNAERNDRIVCVEKGNHSYTHIKHIDELGEAFEKELEDFFVNYHQLSGKTYRILGVKGPASGAPAR